MSDECPSSRPKTTDPADPAWIEELVAEIKAEVETSRSQGKRFETYLSLSTTCAVGLAIVAVFVSLAATSFKWYSWISSLAAGLAVIVEYCRRNMEWRAKADANFMMVDRGDALRREFQYQNLNKSAVSRVKCNRGFSV